MRVKIITTSLLVAFTVLIAFSKPSFAQASCLPFLLPQNLDVNSVQLVTLNRNGTASFSGFGVSYKPGIKIPNLGSRPAKWSTDTYFTPKDVSHQLFSDRAGNVGAEKMQPFDIAQADLINVVITVEASPQVTFTLRSWGNTKAVFRGTCSTGGVIHGSTPDVDYLLYLTQFQIR